ncbi:MAG: cell division protein FtsI/penicillin-binding protein 2 [Bacteroidetes bacterium]|nr:MAG: cell division protein FtsI/penicillin-binding protein 2 [Bacteroidota bacterium]
MEENKDILKRVYVVYAVIILLAAGVVSRVIYIQAVQGERWKAEAENLTRKVVDVEAVRGNIFATDGSLLATSVPYYEVGIDPLANEHFDNDMFDDSALALANGLAALLKGKSGRDYYRMIMSGRAGDDRFVQLAKNVSHNDLQEIKKLPLFRLGRYKGGLIWPQTNKRERPFRMLAARTIGYVRDSAKPIGLEGAFDSVLTGVSGKRLMQKIAGGVWMPVNNDNEVEPQNGKDVVTTIDINIQDVAENALLHSLIRHNAKYGCVVLMEVKTGEIRAIANLTRSEKDSAHYDEDYNYAIGDAREPGSTFKLASMIVGMDQGFVNPKDKVNLEGGLHMFYNLPMKDSHTPKKNDVTVEEAFWESSNVGISKVVYRSFSKDPGKFTDGLRKLHLHEPLGLAIPGAGTPYIKDPSDKKNWNGTSLPWISIGYESLVTPLHTLTLYNAVANNGTMVKPMFVKEVKLKGQTIKTYQPEIIEQQIAKPETIEKAKSLLEGVVQHGTGAFLKASVFKIAGKTGTAQVANNGAGYKGKEKITYQASFVGYFPADNPKYTCIVIVNAPSNDAYYGGAVAGPIFKQIADRVYSTNLDIHKPVNVNAQPLIGSVLPEVKKGAIAPTLDVLKSLNLPVENNAMSSGWISAQSGTTKISANPIGIEQALNNNQMPDLTGLTASEVLFLLENKGLRVRVRGSGSVFRQSLPAGTKFNKGTEIIIELAS